MYSNHAGYNALTDFLEENELGWSVENFNILGKRFVEGMSKAFFECSPSTLKALNDRHNTNAWCIAFIFICIIIRLCECECVYCAKNALGKHQPSFLVINLRDAAR